MGKPRSKTVAGALVLLASIALAGLVYGCAPQASSADNATDGKDSKPEAAEPVAIDWSPETDCALCHTKEAESVGNSACDMSQHSTMTCVECHADEAQLSKMHEGATTADRAPTRLKKTGVDKEGCLSCHAQDEIAKKSAESTVLTDVNGTVVNPHDIPDTPGHAEITCSDCHEMHDEAAGRPDEANKLCTSCHHSEVYECYTCHQHG